MMFSKVITLLILLFLGCESNPVSQYDYSEEDYSEDDADYYPGYDDPIAWGDCELPKRINTFYSGKFCCAGHRIFSNDCNWLFEANDVSSLMPSSKQPSLWASPNSSVGIVLAILNSLLPMNELINMFFFQVKENLWLIAKQWTNTKNHPVGLIKQKEDIFG